MSDLLHLDCPIEIEARADGPKQGPRFSSVAYSGGAMDIGGYGPTVIDLAGADVSGTIPILSGHAAGLDDIVGQGDAVVRSGQLIVSGPITSSTPAGQRVLALTRDGIALQASVGFAPNKIDRLRAGEKVNVNGRAITAGEHGLVVVRSGKLREVSLLPIGADPHTTVTIAAQSGRKDTPMAVENITTPADDIRAAAAIEATRIADIRAIGPKYPAIAPAKLAEIEAKAISEGWPAVQAELAILRAERGTPPPVCGSTRDQANSEVLTAALCMKCNVAHPEKLFSQEVLDRATDRRIRDVTLGQVLMSAAASGGYDAPMGARITSGNVREVLRAAFSVHSLTTLLSDLGHKVLSDGFSSVSQPWREVAQVRSVSDFKQVTAYRMTADLEYEEVAPSGEIEHGTLGQESYTLQAKTYAKMLTLTRTDIINDDLGAFNDLRNRLGIGAAIKLNKVFWTAWLTYSNAGTFWTEGRGNLVTSSAFGDTGIAAAVKAFRNLEGPDGNPMDLVPVKVLVPPDLEATALRYFNSAEMRDTTSDTNYVTANIYQNRFKPIVVPQLSSAAYTGYSATTWWLLADPAILASAAVCFLNGQQAPTVESADADFDTLGIQFRGYHDFGVSMSEYRASVKATA